jgi:hypothetical protein
LRPCTPIVCHNRTLFQSFINFRAWIYLLLRCPASPRLLHSRCVFSTAPTIYQRLSVSTEPRWLVRGLRKAESQVRKPRGVAVARLAVRLSRFAPCGACVTGRAKLSRARGATRRGRRASRNASPFSAPPNTTHLPSRFAHSVAIAPSLAHPSHDVVAAGAATACARLNLRSLLPPRGPT